MAPSAGARLGAYEVVSPLVAGGMGEVYKARDTRLDRTVAVKVLREHLANRRARFERKARAISTLNHPHICTLYDVDRDNGIDYFVVEWSPTGHELIDQNGTAILSVNTSANRTFTASAPTKLFEAPVGSALLRITPDRQEIVLSGGAPPLVNGTTEWWCNISTKN